MRPVILDIGAGSLYFARRLKWYNWKKKQIIFCGEPNWKKSINTAQVRELIKKDANGIYTIISEYDSFDFEDESLDMVILNAPHIMMPPTGIESELLRCLKKDGVFFFSYPVDFFTPHFPNNTFSLLTKKHFHGTSMINLGNVPQFPSCLPNIIVPSKTMQYNIQEARLRHLPGYHNSMGDSYIYRGIQLCNMYEVWQKL